MAGNSNATSLNRVLILAMTTFLGNLIPAVFFYELYYVTYLHSNSQSGMMTDKIPLATAGLN